MIFLDNHLRARGHDFYLYPDLLNGFWEKIWSFTHTECAGCRDHGMLGVTYTDCAYSSIRYVYQCTDCGNIIDPDSDIIIENFHPDHKDYL